MTEQPRKTLSIKPKTAPAVDTESKPSQETKPLTRGNKRIIKREQVQATALAKPKAKLPKKQNKPRKPAPKKPLVSPSDIRVDNLNLSLNNFEVWRAYQPLALGIEREIFQYVAKHRISASKRVVQKLLKQHTQQASYQQQLSLLQQRYHLDGKIFI
ncbi:MAG: Fertility inhibition FinO [Thiothrix sp.]|nr:MAG: Fertility inhibition FinO [Thiothrix sp.]